MRSIALPGVPDTDAQLSVVGFGCSALLGRASRRESLLALNTAFDAGITFYDTARSYGYGAAEGLLGGFLAAAGSSRREKIILSTKFGILPVARNWKSMVKPVARAAVRLVPSLRQAAQRHAAGQFNTNQFSLTNLQSSLETSLRQLRTEYVDMLFLHEAPASVLAQDDLLEALGKLVEQGKVRRAGISAEHAVIETAFAKPHAPLTVAQFAMNLSNLGFAERTVQEKSMLLVANHPFGGSTGVEGSRERIAKLAASKKLSAEIREKLTLDDPQLLPELVLNAVITGTGISAVVPAMMTPAHIHSNIRAVESCRFTAEELGQIRGALA